MAEFQQTGDCCSVKGRGLKVLLSWTGQVPLTGYNALRMFTAFSPDASLSGWAVLDGKRSPLFCKVKGDKVPIEPTSAPILRENSMAILTHLEFELCQAKESDIAWNLYWIGAVHLAKDRLLEAPLPYPKNWEGLFHSLGVAKLRNPWIASDVQLQEWKRRAGTEEFASIREQFMKAAKAWEDYTPENHLREFLPVEEHLYRFVRVRDRARPLWDEPVTVLSLAGFLFDEPRWTRLAARFLLCMAFTPKWFEGPQGCFPGSKWHHVCFVESHNLNAAVFALQFVGNALTDEGRQRIVCRLKETWTLVNSVCEEPGYRWFMNQGVVFNSIRLAAATALFQETDDPDYRKGVVQSYNDHCRVMENYLAPDGHCCEGPHYFAYGMGSSIAGWMAYAAFQGVSILDVLPTKFRRSNTYVNITTSSLRTEGACVPLCAAGHENWPSGLLALLSCCENGAQSATFLESRLANSFENDKLSAWDTVLLLALPWRKSMQGNTEPTARANRMVSGIASVSWNSPQPGKLILTVERPSTGHHHYDRGGIILEAGGDSLLVDPGMTNYAYVRCAQMREPDWHNTSHPVGLPMKCNNRPETFDPNYPVAALELRQKNVDQFPFTMDLAPIYEPLVQKAVRSGELILDPIQATGVLEVRDDWEFTEPQSLEVTWQSYAPWVIQQGTVVRATSGKLEITCRARLGQMHFVDALADRVDWSFKTVYTLRVRTIPSTAAVIESRVSFGLGQRYCP